jgi:hypothetical protein
MRLRRSVLLPLAAAATLWLEPITATLGYGQINLVIALLIVGEGSRRDSARSKGALIGIAAGLKLRPLIFVPYLLFSRRARPAFVALETFAATIAVAYAALPGDRRALSRGPSRVPVPRSPRRLIGLQNDTRTSQDRCAYASRPTDRSRGAGKSAALPTTRPAPARSFASSHMRGPR